MHTTVTDRGQISIPAALREKYELKSGTIMEWVEQEGKLWLVPIEKDPIAAFRGSGKSTKGDSEAELLLKARAEERKREQRER